MSGRAIKFAVLLLLLSGSARGASQCTHSMADLKKALPKAKFEILNAGQYHFAAGMFVATPPVSPAIPPSDGAVLISLKGEKVAKVMWMLEGKICPGGFDLSTNVARLVLSINPKPGETIDPSDDEGDLHL